MSKAPNKLDFALEIRFSVLLEYLKWFQQDIFGAFQVPKSTLIQFPIDLLVAQNSAGFLPTRGSFMLDFVFVAMFAIVIVLAYSIIQVKKGKYRLHKRIQISTALILLVTIVAFEVDLRFLTDWRSLAAPSPFFESGGIYWALGVHLVFAIPTPFVWIYTMTMALKKMPKDPGPCEYSPRHRIWGWASAIMMFGTAVTGWAFYLLAFVC